MAFELANTPVTATTLSCVANLVIALADSEGSLLLSAMTARICLPSTPPLALISLNAILAPLAAEVPKVALPPVISFSRPILMLLESALLPHPASKLPVSIVNTRSVIRTRFLFFI